MTDLLRHPAAQMACSDVPVAPMTVRAASERLGLAKSSLYNAIQSGLIKVVRFGGTIRIDRAEVERIAIEGLPALTRDRKPTRAEMQR